MSDQMQMSQTVEGRSCGDCSLCCKLPRIDAVDKPAGTWCRHCAPGRGGCTIYDSRPSSCRAFHCGWIVDADLGPEWRPLTSKMIAVLEQAGRRIAVHVDPSYPDAWRRQPYYRQLKRWSQEAVEVRRQVIIHIRRKAIVILPDRDIDLGDVLPDEQIWVGAHDTPVGLRWSAAKIPADVLPEQAASWIASQTAGKP
jgi:Fe-S-cluster containining protein